MDKVLFNNKDVKISIFEIGGTIISKDTTPKRPITEWTPAYEKRVAKDKKEVLG